MTSNSSEAVSARRPAKRRIASISILTKAGELREPGLLLTTYRLQPLRPRVIRSAK